ncbi:MAG: DNA mismatch repair protein MutS, partial [Clostridiales bacterium]|nr:DNA mismatch repair protein MutS [Clostridiales bacterium]
MSLTPMMKQYLEVKDANKDCLIFYRLGDFYEMFFDDAVTASKELELTLTARDCGLPERAPMCGVPYHAVDGYINKLVSRGYKVAICEQLTEAGKSALVERGIVRIATAGTVIDSTALEEDRNNYVASVSGSAGGFGVAWIDITTGEYNIQELAPDSKLLNDLLLLIRPAEIICDEYVLAD